MENIDTMVELEVNEWCKKVSEESQAWFNAEVVWETLGRDGCSEEERFRYADGKVCGKQKWVPDFKAGLLASLALPFADYTQLRLCSDYLHWMTYFEWWTLEGQPVFYVDLRSNVSATRVSEISQDSEPEGDKSKIVREGFEKSTKIIERVILFCSLETVYEPPASESASGFGAIENGFLVLLQKSVPSALILKMYVLTCWLILKACYLVHLFIFLMI